MRNTALQSAQPNITYCCDGVGTTHPDGELCCMELYKTYYYDYYFNYIIIIIN